MTRGFAGRASVVWLVLGVTAGSLAALAIVVLTLNVFGSSASASAAAPPHFVEEAAAAGVITSTTATSRSSSAGASPRSTATTTDGRISTSPEAPTPPPSIATRARSEASCDSPDPGSRHRSRARRRRLPRGYRRGRTIDLAVLRYGENVLLRGLGDCRFERANEAWGYDGGDAWTTAFSAKWEGSAKLPTLAFGNYLDMSHGQQHATCADNEMVRPKNGAATYAEPIPLTPGWCTLSILFSDWDRSGRVDLRSPTTGTTTWTARSSCGASTRASLHVCTATKTDGSRSHLGHGHRQLDVTGDGLPEVFLTSQGDNKLQTLADGAAQPHYRDIALQTGVTAPRPYTGGDVFRPRPGIPSSRT